ANGQRKSDPYDSLRSNPDAAALSGSLKNRRSDGCHSVGDLSRNRSTCLLISGSRSLPASSTKTRRPCESKAAAVATPVGPAPTTMFSYTSMPGHSPPTYTQQDSGDLTMESTI